MLSYTAWITKLRWVQESASKFSWRGFWFFCSNCSGDLSVRSLDLWVSSGRWATDWAGMAHSRPCIVKELAAVLVASWSCPWSSVLPRASGILSTGQGAAYLVAQFCLVILALFPECSTQNLLLQSPQQFCWLVYTLKQIPSASFNEDEL